MSFRFRKTIRILPGLRLNLSKTGVSTSVGKQGATVNFSSRGVRGTVGLPGSGLSYSETAKPEGGKGWVLWLVLAVLVVVFVFGR